AAGEFPVCDRDNAGLICYLRMVRRHAGDLLRAHRHADQEGGRDKAQGFLSKHLIYPPVVLDVGKASRGRGKQPGHCTCTVACASRARGVMLGLPETPESPGASTVISTPHAACAILSIITG